MNAQDFLCKNIGQFAFVETFGEVLMQAATKTGNAAAN
jgi:hypothetical protein